MDTAEVSCQLITIIIGFVVYYARAGVVNMRPVLAECQPTGNSRLKGASSELVL